MPNDSFQVSVSFIGVADTFVISDLNGSDTMLVTSPGTYVFSKGLYATSTLVFPVVSVLNDVCSDTAMVITADCGTPPVCVIPEFEATAICAGPDDFQVQVVITDGDTGNIHTISVLYAAPGGPQLPTGALNVAKGDTVLIPTLIPNNSSVVVTVINDPANAPGSPCFADTTFSFDCTVASPPFNDLCDNAIPLACGSFSASFAGATGTDAPFTSCNGVSLSGPGIWYTVQGNGDPITVSTCASIPPFDTRIFVFTGNCSAFNCLASNDNNPSCFLGTSEVTFNTSPFQTYYLYITDPDSTGNNFQLEINCLQVKIAAPILKLSVPRRTRAVDLRWDIASELGIDGYQIERSTDGVYWQTLHWYNVSGLLTSRQTHQYRDATVSYGQQYYYRIRAVAHNGDYAFSNVEDAYLQGGGTIIGQLYPNPARTSATVELSVAEPGELHWQFIDNRGMLIRDGSSAVNRGEQKLDLDVRWLSSGSYWVRFELNDQRETRKLLIVR